MHTLLLIPLLACAVQDDGNVSVVAARALDVAGLGRSFVVFEPPDIVDPSWLAPTGAEGGGERGDAAVDEKRRELDRCWREYVAALDAARSAMVKEMTREGGGLQLPEPGSDGARRITAAVGEIDVAGQRLLADSCLPESARRTALRRAVVRLLADGRYRHEPFLSCTSGDAALDLETAAGEPARALRERLMKVPEARERLDEALQRFAVVATEHRKGALAAWRAGDLARSRAPESSNPDERARARKRVLQVPRTWWREQQGLMDQVQAIASDHGAAALARRWRMDFTREAFPAFIPAVDLEGTLRAAHVDPAAIEIDGWETFWLGYLNDRDAAAMTLVDRALAMTEALRRATPPGDPDRDGPPLRARIDALMRAGDQYTRVETTAATRAAELLGESHSRAVVAVIDYLGQIDQRAWAAWRIAVDMTEQRAAAIEKESAPAGQPVAAPGEDPPHEPEPDDESPQAPDPEARP